MKYIKCPMCGGETPSVLSRCRICGERLPMQEAEEEMHMPKERNGFVSFWLWVCLAINVLVTIGYFLLMFSSKGLWSSAPEPFSLRLFWFISSVAIVAGYWLLISWKKVGFGILSAAAIINGIVSLCISSSMGSLFTPIASIVILYLILQISKDGRSCWDQLS